MSAHVAHVADSFEFMRHVDPRTVDVLLTDPPYSPHVHANLCSGSLVGTKAVPKYELPFAPLQGYAWLEDAVRITKRWVVSFCDVEAFGLIKGVCPETYVRGGIWYKSNAMGQLTKDRPATAYEGIALLHGRKDEHPKKRWNGKGSYGIWRANGTRSKRACGLSPKACKTAGHTDEQCERHPNEKPIDLALKLVALFSERGETVFDPFCGSAAIGEACVRLGRNYVGLDNDLHWVARARSRLAKPLESMTDEAALALCSMRGADPPEEKNDVHANV